MWSLNQQALIFHIIIKNSYFWCVNCHCKYPNISFCAAKSAATRLTAVHVTVVIIAQLEYCLLLWGCVMVLTYICFTFSENTTDVFLLTAAHKWIYNDLDFQFRDKIFRFKWIPLTVYLFLISGLCFLQYRIKVPCSDMAHAFGFLAEVQDNYICLPCTTIINLCWQVCSTFCSMQTCCTHAIFRCATVLLQQVFKDWYNK